MHAWHGLQRRDPVIEGRIDYNGDEFVVDDQLMISILAGSEYCCNK
ncbi:hypothetical protein NC653_040423 [Populus alba x Populus x berolinensis]|uniref:Uncharacterized protein n=1 Tax=Populus alba x Populus x berolinensis TaxID=444605 RepID=A0AAD6LF90_9ROSI|nr:hypothetical protein NC653_039837 [Populus alba x Populus x berolinensis]KAJ6958788.1 hypothetical protein NC653_040423 [Populus alba x Populus x berolinensis]